ncbi:hypothetical protein I317_00959 [Kwoniella heveanensis CBS 569]|nr:hypothetical protein I317_00959 [Kwoniella heveanensis CBS 569]
MSSPSPKAGLSGLPDTPSTNGNAASPKLKLDEPEAEPESTKDDAPPSTSPSKSHTEDSPSKPQVAESSPAKPRAPPKSKVRAAAAMFEKPNSDNASGASGSSSPSISTPKSSLDRPRPPKSPLSSAGSFRSVPVSDQNSGPDRLSPEKPSMRRFGSRSPSPTPSQSPSFRKLSTDDAPAAPNLNLDSPFVARAVSPSPVVTSSSSSSTAERFSDISLSEQTPQSKPDPPSEVEVENTPPSRRKDLSVSPNPPKPVDLSDELPEPVVTPPAKEPVKSSFFSSALGFGFPSSSSNAIVSEPTPTSNAPSRQASASEQGQASAAGGWRSTMSNLLGSRSTSSVTSPLPPSEPVSVSASATSSSSQRPTEALTRNPSEGTSFLLHRVDSTTASRDRRISAQLGGGQAIREGFERVRGAMETAAREMRRERESRATLNAGTGEDADMREEADEAQGDEKVDWTFWGAVVQDFEEVARNRPKELSRAIQQGIPQVIRGAIWQLMSSSKSTPLEETYKALLKLPSPHEKAINKDINRTFPNHKYFQEGGGIGQEGLFMVVKAYSLYDPEVGYTQGLAFIVAALLLNMPDEEAFCVLVRLMDSYNLRSHYTAEMQGLQLRLFQFDRLVEEILPLLHTHFVRKGVKSSIYAAQWFMTLFSYRFPLSLVYRVLDIVFAEGIEAIFRFSLALLKKSEDQLLELEFEQILNYLQSDLFEVYRVDDSKRDGEGEGGGGGGDPHSEEEWKANEFVRDAYEIRITPFMLDSYASEWEEQLRSQNRHALEVDQLRNANRNLSAQVKQLEASLATMNQEHVELVRQLVMSKIEKEETENELVRYKMLYAELAHAQQDALSNHSRLSGGSMNNQTISNFSTDNGSNGSRPPS